MVICLYLKVSKTGMSQSTGIQSGYYITNARSKTFGTCHCEHVFIKTNENVSYCFLFRENISTALVSMKYVT